MAGTQALDEPLHQRFGGGRQARFSAVVTGWAITVVVHRRPAALAEQAAAEATDTAGTGPARA